MKNLIALLAFVMMSQAYAQAPQVQYVQPQQAAPIYVQAPQAQATAPAQAEATASAPNASPIYILNNQHLQGYQGTSQIQESPTTVVQEAPVKVSASATIRKEREGAEAATEDGIVQTLEKARLDDEVRRREKFNNALATAPAATAVVQAPTATTSATSIVNAPGAQNVITNTTAITEQNDVVEVTPPKPVKRKKVILEDETREEKVEIVRSEVHAAIAETALPIVNPTQYYVGALIGTQNYPDAANVRGKMSSGVALGMITSDRFVIEGSFLYSKADVDDLRTVQTLDMTQYNLAAAAKYQLLPGRIRPTVGGVASYTHRNYDFQSNCACNSGDSATKTDAIDAGLQAGVDVAVSSNFSIGADLKYLWNITNKVSGSDRSSSSNSYAYGPQVKYVEDFSYYMATVSAKFLF